MSGTWLTQIQDRLKEACPPDRSYDTEALEEAELPQAVRHFLIHALRRRALHISVDVDERWFDPSDEAVKEAEKNWRDAMAATARYPADIWHQTLDSAAGYVVSFLVKPADTLAEFVFSSDDDTRAAAEIRERLGYFDLKTTFKKSLSVALKEKGDQQLAAADLCSLAKRIDHAATRDLSPSDWVEALEPLFEYSVSGDTLPAQVLKEFFEQKGQPEISRRIEALEDVRGLVTLDKEDVRRVADPEIAIVPEEEPEEEIAEEMPSAAKPRQAVAAEGARSVPRWMQFKIANEQKRGSASASASRQGKRSKKSSPPVTVVKPSPVNKPEAAAQSRRSLQDAVGEAAETVGRRPPVPDDLGDFDSSANGSDSTAGTADGSDSGGSVPRWRRFQQGGDSGPEGSQPVHDTRADDPETRVLGSLNSVQRKWYINHLFGGDPQRWQTVIRLLDQAPDWDSATEVIAEEIFDRQGVDIYSKPAVEFTNAVEARYLR